MSEIRNPTSFVIEPKFLSVQLPPFFINHPTRCCRLSSKYLYCGIELAFLWISCKNRDMRLRNIPEAKEIVANSPFVLKDAEALRGKWQAFTGGRPLYVEIGTGKGRFLMELAAREPERYFLGVERYESVLMRAVEKMEGKLPQDPASVLERAEVKESQRNGAELPEMTGIPEEAELSKAEHLLEEADLTEEKFEPPENLRFLCMDARDLPAVFAPGEVAKIFLNFSDPWPKVRHAKRRLTSRNFLAVYEEFLANGGILEFKTDNRDLFEFSVEEFDAAEHWTLTAVTRDLHADSVLGADNVMTEYERKFSALGNKICKLVAVYHNEKEE